MDERELRLILSKVRLHVSVIELMNRRPAAAVWGSSHVRGLSKPLLLLIQDEELEILIT